MKITVGCIYCQATCDVDEAQAATTEPPHVATCPEVTLPAVTTNDDVLRELSLLHRAWKDSTPASVRTFARQLDRTMITVGRARSAASEAALAEALAELKVDDEGTTFERFHAFRLGWTAGAKGAPKDPVYAEHLTRPDLAKLYLLAFVVGEETRSHALRRGAEALGFAPSPLRASAPT